MADQPWHELPPEIAARTAPAARRRRRRDHRRGPHGSRLRPSAARGEFGEGVRAGVQEALRHFLAEIEAGGPVGALGRLPRARPRGDARRAQPRVAAERLPRRRSGRLAAVRGRRRRRPASSRRRCICWPSRSSPTSTCSRPSRPRATRSSSRRRPSEAELRRRRLVRMLVREPPLDPAAIEAAAQRGRLAAAADARGAGDRRRAARRGRAARCRRRDRERSASSRARSSPTPTARGAAPIERAVVDAGATAGLGTTVDWSRGRASASRRARAALELADGEPALIVARELRRRAAAAQRPAARRELAADRLAPLAELSAGLARRA